MSSFIEIEFYKFLRDYLDSARPVLLALSGGSDSMALWHLLLRYRKRWPLDFRVVHVDHAWRQESFEQAQYLRDMVEAEAVPFHCIRLPTVPQRNLEEEGRRARLAYYKEVQQATRAQAVLLGHHRDDQAETVLKRLLEGASLSKLRGLERDRTVCGVRLWRPLLAVSKEQIQLWLSDVGGNFLADSSNQDSRFLRNRFRQHVWPVLEKNLGKEIASQLGRLAEEASAFRAYLDEKVSDLRQRVIEVDGGFELDLADEEPVCMLEACHLFRDLFSAKGLSLAGETLEGVCRAWLERRSCKVFRKGNYVIRVHCGKVSLQKAPIQCS